MELNDFVGKQSDIQFFYNWLRSFYRGNTETNYAIIIGRSGNGKTLLLKLLAKELEAELFRVHPLSVESKEDLDSIIKSINLDSLDHKRKLILIDDMDEYHSNYKKGLFFIPEISRYPVVYTSKEFMFPQNIREGSFKTKKGAYYFGLPKPTTNSLLEYLKTKQSNLSETEFRTIAEESKSVRSAILSLRNKTVNTLVSEEQSRYEIIDSIRERRLKVPITRKNFRWIWESIQGAKSIADLDAVMTKFADFNFRIYAQNEDIDPFFVNNMKEPVERIMWQYKFERKKKTERKRKVEPKKVKSEKPKLNLVNPLDKWGV